MTFVEWGIFNVLELCEAHATRHADDAFIGTDRLPIAALIKGWDLCITDIFIFLLFWESLAASFSLRKTYEHAYSGRTSRNLLLFLSTLGALVMMNQNEWFPSVAVSSGNVKSRTWIWVSPKHYLNLFHEVNRVQILELTKGRSRSDVFAPAGCNSKIKRSKNQTKHSK